MILSRNSFFLFLFVLFLFTGTIDREGIGGGGADLWGDACPDLEIDPGDSYYAKK